MIPGNKASLLRLFCWEGCWGEAGSPHPPCPPCQEVTLQTHCPLAWAPLAARREGQASSSSQGGSPNYISCNLG